MTASQHRYRDPNVLTDLTADVYDYGGGRPMHGIQLTLERDLRPSFAAGRPMNTLRLPHPHAVALARWILATYNEPTHEEPCPVYADGVHRCQCRTYP